MTPPTSSPPPVVNAPRSRINPSNVPPAVVHAPRSSCANLLNLNVGLPIDVNCPRCLIFLNKTIVRKVIAESSYYQHSGFKGVDHKRKMPEWVILGFKSYTTPQYAIRSAVKEPNPLLYFEKREFTMLVAKRNMNPVIDESAYLNAFKTMFNFTCAAISDNSVTFNYSIRDSELEYRDSELKVLEVKTDLGYIVQYTLMVLIGKMSNILAVIPDIDRFKLMSQIFSNQSNPVMINYRIFIRLLLNGHIKDLWNNPQSYVDYVPQLAGLDLFDTTSPPSWVPTRLPYKAEYKLISGEVKL